MIAQEAINLSDERIESLRDLARRDQMMRYEAEAPPVTFDGMGQDSRLVVMLEGDEIANV